MMTDIEIGCRGILKEIKIEDHTTEIRLLSSDGVKIFRFKDFNVDHLKISSEIQISGVEGLHDDDILWIRDVAIRVLKSVDLVTIKEFNKSTIVTGFPVTISGIIRSITPIPNKPYSRFIMIQDETDTITFPVWSESAWSCLEIDKFYDVSGTVAYYEEKAQIKSPSIIESKPRSMDGFTARYIIPGEETNKFKDFIVGLKEPYSAFATSCIVDCDCDFFSAPSAEKHHHNKIGGLFLHTWGVVKNLRAMLDIYPNIDNIVNRDRLYLKGILHDIGKIEEYEWKNGVIRRKEIALHHIEMGVAIVIAKNKELNIFDEKERNNICQGILSHHGAYGKHEIKTLEDTLLHQADMIDSNVYKHMESTIV